MLEFFKSLADPTRLRLLAILQRGEFTVQDLVEILATGQSRISHHLKVLLEAGLVEVTRQGTWSYYCLARDHELFAHLLPRLEPRWNDFEGHAADMVAVTRLLAERRRRSQEFFDRHARDWDRLVQERLPTPQVQDLILERVPDCGQLLEVGVGTGNLLQSLSAKASRVIGVDHSAAMVAAARERVALGGETGIEVRLGEMEHLPLAEASVDAVILNMVLHHAADPADVLAEVARVLRPGGTLVLCDLARHGAEWVREELADQWLGFAPDVLISWCAAAGLADVVLATVPGAAHEFPLVLLSARRNEISRSPRPPEKEIHPQRS